MRWQSEATALIVQSLTKKLRVGGECKRLEAGSFHSGPDVLVDVHDLRQVDLVHFHAVRCGSANLLVGGCRPGREHEWRLSLVAGASRRNLALGSSHSLEGSRRDTDGAGNGRAKDVGLGALPFGLVHESSLDKLQIFEGLILLLQGHLVIGARVKVVVSVHGKAVFGVLLVIGDLEEALVIVARFHDYVKCSNI